MLSLFAIERLESGGGSGGGERESSVFERTSLSFHDPDTLATINSYIERSEWPETEVGLQLLRYMLWHIY